MSGIPGAFFSDSEDEAYTDGLPGGLTPTTESDDLDFQPESDIDFSDGDELDDDDEDQEMADEEPTSASSNSDDPQGAISIGFDGARWTLDVEETASLTDLCPSLYSCDAPSIPHRRQWECSTAHQRAPRWVVSRFGLSPRDAACSRRRWPKSARSSGGGGGGGG